MKAATYAQTIKAMCLKAGKTEEEISVFVGGLLQGKKQNEVNAADVEIVKAALEKK